MVDGLKDSKPAASEMVALSRWLTMDATGVARSVAILLTAGLVRVLDSPDEETPMALFTCEACGYQQVVPDEHRNRRARCPECGNVNRILDQPPSSERRSFLSRIGWSGNSSPSFFNSSCF